MGAESQTTIDWQPPSDWTRFSTLSEFKAWVNETNWSGRAGDPGDRHMRKHMIFEWTLWHADPSAYRAARISDLKDALEQALRPNSHDVARRLLELPDLPLIFHDDWCHVRAERVVVEDEAEIYSRGEFVTTRAVVLKGARQE